MNASVEILEPRRRPTQERSQKKFDLILQTSRDLLLESGFESFTLRGGREPRRHPDRHALPVLPEQVRHRVRAGPSGRGRGAGGARASRRRAADPRLAPAPGPARRPHRRPVGHRPLAPRRVARGAVHARDPRDGRRHRARARRGRLPRARPADAEARPASAARSSPRSSSTSRTRCSTSRSATARSTPRPSSSSSVCSARTCWRPSSPADPSRATARALASHCACPREPPCVCSRATVRVFASRPCVSSRATSSRVRKKWLARPRTVARQCAESGSRVRREWLARGGSGGEDDVRDRVVAVVAQRDVRAVRRRGAPRPRRAAGSRGRPQASVTSSIRCSALDSSMTRRLRRTATPTTP